MDHTPLIVHVIYRLAVGGLENGLVNLINNMPREKYRHVIICADTYTDFRNRIHRNDVEVYALNKKPGNDFFAYWRLWRLLRRLEPDIVHTRNLGTIEYVLPAKLAGVKYCVHGEHGRDMTDIDGTNTKYIKLRQFYSWFINHFIAVSKDLEQWLNKIVSIEKSKISQIYNGVNITRFGTKTYRDINDEKNKLSKFVIGSVGRLQAEKDQSTLVKAFEIFQQKYSNAELHLVGDGPDRGVLEDLVTSLGLMDKVVFHGRCDNVPQLMSMLDVFVLPSLGEGVSNTILEAMSCGLPVIATNVGGNPELVEDGVTGYLVDAASPVAIAQALKKYVDHARSITLHGSAGRMSVEKKFSMEKMCQNYMAVYDKLLEN